MNLPWTILAVLLIGAAMHMSYAQEEVVGSAADPQVGAPLGGLVIAKGIKKIALFEGLQKIKLKLSKLGLKKGLFLAKLPWLAAANPNMDSSDVYYIGVPDTVGAHMWSGQHFDSDFHPELERVEVEDLHDFHNHVGYHQDRHVGNIDHSEFISAHTAGHPMTEIYNFELGHEQSIPYHARQFVDHEFDPFEQERQESRYYVTSVRNPNEGTYPQMPSDTPMGEGTDQGQHTTYTKYYPQQVDQNVQENSDQQSGQYHVLQSESQTKEISPEKIQVWYTSNGGGNMQSNINTEPVQDVQQEQHNQEVQTPMLVWNANSNIPASVPVQATQNGQSNQDVQTAMYVWNPQKKAENSQPQILVWQPAKSDEMLAARTTMSDNMSHLPNEEANVNPMIMQEYLQAVEGFGNVETPNTNQQYYESNIQMTEQNSAIKAPEYVAKKEYEAADVAEPKWTLITMGTTPEKDSTKEQTYMYPAEKVSIDSTKEQTYMYPAKKVSVDSKRNNIDVSSRISMEGAGIEKRQMASNTCGSSAFTEAFNRLAQASQNVQGAKSMQDSRSNEPQMANQRFSQSLDSQKYSNLHQQSQSSSERAIEQEHKILSNQELPQSPGDGRATSQGQDQMYYGMEPQHMYQTLAGEPRVADDQAPHVVIDNQPLSAFILPSEEQPTAEVMQDHSDPRTSYDPQSQLENQQNVQLQYQTPTSQNYYTSATAPQFSQPENSQYAQHSYQEENPISPEGQYRTTSEAQDDQSYAVQPNEEAQTPSETDVGLMGPQVPDHARTFHKKYLFGLKKQHKYGGHNTHYHYHTHGGYGGGHGYGSYGYGGYGSGGHGYGGYGSGGHGYGGYGSGGHGYGGHGYGGHGYYSHSYGYLGQQNPSTDTAQQETTPGQDIQDPQTPHMTPNMEMMPSASNDDPQIMKPAEPPCPCARSWNEGAPVYHEDRRGYYGYGSPDMVGTPFTGILSRPYLGMWGPGSLLAPLYRQPQYYVPERFEDSVHNRFQRDSAKMVDDLTQAAKDKLQELKLKAPRPLSDILIDKPQILEFIKKECGEKCNKCKKDCDSVEDTTDVEPLILSSEKET